MGPSSHRGGIGPIHGRIEPRAAQRSPYSFSLR
jgi:hypothetical protein